MDDLLVGNNNYHGGVFSKVTHYCEGSEPLLFLLCVNDPTLFKKDTGSFSKVGCKIPLDFTLINIS